MNELILIYFIIKNRVKVESYISLNDIGNLDLRNKNTSSGTYPLSSI